MKKRQVGISMIEVVIVIIVLGIIAAVAAPKLAKLPASDKSSSTLNQINAFKAALTITQALKTTSTPSWIDMKDNLDGFLFSEAGIIVVDFDGDNKKDLAIVGYDDNCMDHMTANGSVLNEATAAVAGDWKAWTAITYQVDGSTILVTQCTDV